MRILYLSDRFQIKSAQATHALKAPGQQGKIKTSMPFRTEALAEILGPFGPLGVPQACRRDALRRKGDEKSVRPPLVLHSLRSQKTHMFGTSLHVCSVFVAGLFGKWFLHGSTHYLWKMLG